MSLKRVLTVQSSRADTEKVSKKLDLIAWKVEKENIEVHTGDQLLVWVAGSLQLPGLAAFLVFVSSSHDNDVNNNNDNNNIIVIIISNQLVFFTFCSCNDFNQLTGFGTEAVIQESKGVKITTTETCSSNGTTPYTRVSVPSKRCLRRDQDNVRYSTLLRFPS